MLPPGFNLTVERLRATNAQDAHGNDIPDWTTPNTLTINGCWIGSAAGVELVDGRQTVVLEQQWFGPEDADLLSTDRLRDIQLNATYVVDGPVMLNRDPTGHIAHKTCKLKQVTE